MIIIQHFHLEANVQIKVQITRQLFFQIDAKLRIMPMCKTANCEL